LGKRLRDEGHYTTSEEVSDRFSATGSFGVKKCLSSTGDTSNIKIEKSYTMLSFLIPQASPKPSKPT